MQSQGDARTYVYERMPLDTEGSNQRTANHLRRELIYVSFGAACCETGQRLRPSRSPSISGRLMSQVKASWDSGPQTQLLARLDIHPASIRIKREIPVLASSFHLRYDTTRSENIAEFLPRLWQRKTCKHLLNTEVHKLFTPETADVNVTSDARTRFHFQLEDAYQYVGGHRLDRNDAAFKSLSSYN
ncbi:hypothetical protein K439DRAFT_1657731 [Ramaria rubella]|nr:hypothetical protein K439DRAFT_1657731 [Ramaria rubella]